MPKALLVCALTALLVACGEDDLLAPVVDDRCPAEQSLSFDYEGYASGFFCASGPFPTGTAGNPFWSTWAHAEIFAQYGSHLGLYGNLPVGQDAGRHIQMDIPARNGGWTRSNPVSGRGMNWFSIRHAAEEVDIYFLESGNIVLDRAVAVGAGGTVWGTFSAVARTESFVDRPEQREVRITNGRFHLRVAQ